MRHSHIFQIIGSDDVIFMDNWWNFDVFGEIFISPEPFNVWSRATPHFNPKTQFEGGIYIAVHHFEKRKWLKIAIFS